MTKKSTLIVVASLLVLIVTAVFALNMPRDPGPFISNKAALTRINAVMNDEATDIQEQMFIDEQHVFLPFKTKGDKYGVSFWVWKKNKWKMTTSDNGGEPKSWIVGKGSTAKSYIVYNLHPEDKISEVKFYLMKDRNFQVSGDTAVYDPKIQIEHTVSLTETTYGFIPYPNSWVQLDRFYRDLEQPGVDEEIYQSPLKVGQLFFRKSGKEVYPEHTRGNYGYGNDQDVKYIIELEEQELE